MSIHTQSKYKHPLRFRQKVIFCLTFLLEVVIKKYGILFICIVALILIAGNYVNACTQRTITMNYFISGPPPDNCSTTITYCYDCAMTGVGFSLTIDKIHMKGGCPMEEEFWTQVNSAIANDLVNQPGSCIAPCDWPGWRQYEAEFAHKMCWKHVHQAGDPVDEYDIVPCDGEDAWCLMLYEVCYDLGPPPAIVQNFLEAIFMGSMDCPYYVEQWDPPYWVVDPEAESWETECFTPPSACDE